MFFVAAYYFVLSYLVDVWAKEAATLDVLIEGSVLSLLIALSLMPY